MKILQVPYSAAGAVECFERCARLGFTHGGLECPMIDQVTCQCATMGPADPPDVLGAVDPVDGTTTQCDNAVGHCSAPAFQWGYRFGGNGRASVYV